MAPVAVPAVDELKMEDLKVEKKPDVVNDEEADEDDEDEAEGGDTAATGGMSTYAFLMNQNLMV
jgi:hypothetical protein